MTHKNESRVAEVLLSLVPNDGSSIGNQALREELSEELGREVDEYEYNTIRDVLVANGQLVKGKGRGGSVGLGQTDSVPFDLQALEVRDTGDAARAKTRLPRSKNRPSNRADAAPQVISYRYSDRRKNNPEVGMVDPDSDPDGTGAGYAYDPHLDPSLQFDVGRAAVERIINGALERGDQTAMRSALLSLARLAEPYLNWSGKAERTSFEIDTVSLHVHERIDPATILGAVQKRRRQGESGTVHQQDWLRAWFEAPLPYREAIEFYKHDRGWANRLIAGDSLLVMNSLIQKESMAGQVQMIYIDPPYGIRYGSNFQPFVNKREVKDRRDEDLTQEPEMIKAFRDTWELGIHSYLAYLRDRLLLSRELLSQTGSIFVQISDENLHHVREVMDEIFGSTNYLNVIPFSKTSGVTSRYLASNVDFLVWYAKDAAQAKYHQLYLDKSRESGTAATYSWITRPSGQRRGLTAAEKRGEDSIPADARLYKPDNITSQGNPVVEFIHEGKTYAQAWKTDKDGVGLRRLARADRLHVASNSLQYVRLLEDFPCIPVTQLWDDMQTGSFTEEKTYVVQTADKVIQRCLLLTTDPGDLVLDPTCGSGTTAYVAEKWGRRWITCDTSRVAVTLAKQRLMTASYDYYELRYPHEGLRGGFVYATVPHITLRSISNNPEIDEIHDRTHGSVQASLEKLNHALRAEAKRRSSTADEGHDKLYFVVMNGGRRGDAIDFSAPSDAFVQLPTGERVPAGALLEWEVPVELPTDWPAEAKAAFDAFHEARRARLSRINASIAANAESETLYDKPEVSRTKRRVSGPFTVEAVPSPMVLSLDDAKPPREADVAIARSGQSSRHHQWRDELTKTGIRGKGGQILRLGDLETLPDTRYLHCSGVIAETGDRVVVSFGPEHAALEQRQVELAIREAGDLFPRPKMIVFCAFAFDPEAAKDIDAIRGITALKAQMNTDLLTEDLKKARANNQSFWLMGQPDVELRKLSDGKFQIEVHGFDYFDTAKGELISGGKGKIAAWAIDTDYDERSLFPRQVFFPMAGAKDGWRKLRNDIKAELDESLLAKLHGTVSLPFEPGDNRKIAVKIVDDRGIESLKIMRLD